jgi:hypothetical protein
VAGGGTAAMWRSDTFLTGVSKSGQLGTDLTGEPQTREWTYCHSDVDVYNNFAGIYSRVIFHSCDSRISLD